MSELIRTEDGKIKFELQIAAEDYVKALDSAYRRLASRYPIPGFRKGKAPRKVIEKSYGANIFWDNEFDALIQQTYSKALMEHSVIPELEPQIIFTDVSEETGVSFTVEIVTRPVVELGQYKGIEVRKVEYTVTEEDVNAEIANRRQSMARTVNVERPVELGDTVTLDFAGFLGDEQFEGGTAEGHSLKIGSHTFIPGFEEQMIGMTIGETRDLNVTFPTEYHEEKLAGKAVIFKVTVHAITVEELPELDDEFVQDTSEFNTVAEYTENIRKELEEKAAQNAKIAFENAAIQTVVDNAKVDIHADIINEEVDMQIKRFEAQLDSFNATLDGYLTYAGLTLEDIRNDYYKGAEASLKAQYVMSAIIDEEKIEPTEENYRSAILRSAPANAKWDDEKINEELSKNRSKYVGNAIFEAFANMIVENAVVTEGCSHDDCDCGCEHDHEGDCDCGCEHDHDHDCDCDCDCKHDHEGDCDCGCKHDHEGDCDCKHE